MAILLHMPSEVAQSYRSCLPPAPPSNLASWSLGYARAARGGTDARLSIVSNLTFQSLLEEDREWLKQRKHCRRQRPDSCFLKKKEIRAVRFG